MDLIQNNMLYIIIALIAVILIGSLALLAIYRSRKSRNESQQEATTQSKQSAQQGDKESEINAAALNRENNFAHSAAPTLSAVETAKSDPRSGLSKEIDAAEKSNISQPDSREAALTSGSGYELPESVPSRMQRLRARLAKGGALGTKILTVLSRSELSAQDWEEIEETLLLADVGLEASTQILENLQREIKVQGNSDPATVKRLLRAELCKAVAINASRELNLETESDDATGAKLPAPILMVGVNGTGKTTTTGKLARLLVAQGHQVVLGAADTFRAAAADQLTTWGERVGVPVVRAQKEGSDPAAVAFETIKSAHENTADVVIVDTAGRLQNKTGLMDELGKIKRVMEKQAPVKEVLLVLDATTGQNGLQQAKVFADVVNITGIVLSKLDGSAKGGIVISVQRALGVPVKFIGLGEGADDFAPFDPENFVDSLLS